MANSFVDIQLSQVNDKSHWLRCALEARWFINIEAYVLLYAKTQWVIKFVRAPWVYLCVYVGVCCLKVYVYLNWQNLYFWCFVLNLLADVVLRCFKHNVTIVKIIIWKLRFFNRVEPHLHWNYKVTTDIFYCSCFVKVDMPGCFAKIRF